MLHTAIYWHCVLSRQQGMTWLTSVVKRGPNCFVMIIPLQICRYTPWMWILFFRIWSSTFGLASVSYKFTLHRKKALEIPKLCVELLQSIYWSGFIYPGSCRWHTLWSHIACVVMHFGPWWAMRKKTVIPRALLSLGMSMRTSSVCDFQDIFFLREWTSPFSLHSFFLACCSSFLWILKKQFRFRLKSSFVKVYCVIMTIFKFSSALLDSRILGKIETCVEKNCTPLIFFFSQSECHGDNFPFRISSLRRGGDISWQVGAATL